MAIQRQKKFNGMVSNIDEVDVNMDNAINSVNMDLSIIGEMSTVNGTTKQNTTAKTNSIVAMIQLGDSSTIVV